MMYTMTAQSVAKVGKVTRALIQLADEYKAEGNSRIADTLRDFARSATEPTLVRLHDAMVGV